MNRLRKLRIERQITQKELAFNLNISQRRVSRMERHLIPMNGEIIERCVHFFGVTADYLLGISDIQVEMELGLPGHRAMSDVPLQAILFYYNSMERWQQDMVLHIAKAIDRGWTGGNFGKKK